MLTLTRCLMSCRSDASPAPLASEASFRFAALPATEMPPVSEALAPLLMPVFGGGAPSDGVFFLTATGNLGLQT